MRKYIILCILPLVFWACSKDGEGTDLELSLTGLHYNVDGGEQVINIKAPSAFECVYTETWLLVRQREGVIRVIADPNNSPEDRMASVAILCEGAVQDEITVTQEGRLLAAETSSFTVSAKGEELDIAIDSNADWEFEAVPSWCNAVVSKGGIHLLVDRNYKMEGRDSLLSIVSGDISLHIKIKQTASQWYESFEMIEIEGGSFLMGAQQRSSEDSNYDANAYQIESPVHQVTLDGYYICKYEITQAQWTAAMGENPSEKVGNQYPVGNVSWEEVMEFVEILNTETGLKYRLPTEAEWEFAASGGHKPDYFKYSGSSVLGACGWYYSNSESKAHEVGTKMPNELGIYDMSGNVREWCMDWFDYYGSADAQNPSGPSRGDLKINRGGSWTTPAVNCRNTYRHMDAPSSRSIDLGFRLILEK